MKEIYMYFVLLYIVLQNTFIKSYIL